MIIDIDLNTVVEKPRLPADKSFTFQFIKATLDIAKTPNKTSGVREPLIKCELTPLEPEWSDRRVFHTFSLSMGGLQSDDACISIKKFFTVVGHPWGSDGRFSVEDLLTIKFVGTVKYKEGQGFANLGSVLQGVS